MLVLTRKAGEVIDVIHKPSGQQFAIVLVDGGRATLGLEAPEEFYFIRREVLERNQGGESSSERTGGRTFAKESDQ